MDTLLSEGSTFQTMVSRPPGTPLQQTYDPNILLSSDVELEAYNTTVAHCSAERQPEIVFYNHAYW